ncbi:hypothetical protein KKA17_10220 [bacterium]|nr:hypothetical protein [bacterium]MBU1883438.1 hypothetical protein [bacterium]
MALSNTHTNWAHGSYTNDRDYYLKEKENSDLFGDGVTNLNAHDDNNGHLAFGYGYDLFANVNNLTTELRPYVSAVGGGDVDVALAEVQNLIRNYNSSTTTLDGLANQINAQITLGTEANAAELLASKATNYETALSAVLGTDNLPQSKERAAIISVLYNLAGGDTQAQLETAIRTQIPSTIQAIRDNNRVAAWYEIRYRSNADSQADTIERGIANRRVNESDTFGLYGSADGITPTNDNEAKNVIRFLEAHRVQIQAEINHVRGLPGNTTYPTLLLGANDLDLALTPAKTRLITNYAQGTTIDGSIIVGQGIGASGESYADTTTSNNDTNLQGTDKNDLIFGEKGDDTLIGGKGTDVLYGGDGDDTLMGYDGYGTPDDESDILQGGNDFDTYIAGNNDIIIDSDGKGEIYFEGKQLTGGTDSLGDGTYISGTLSYKLESTTLTVTDSKTGHTLTVNDLQPSEKIEGEDRILDVGLGIQLESSTKQTTAPTGATYVTVNSTDEWHQYQIPIYATDKDGKTYIDHYVDNPAYIVHWAGSSFSADDDSNLINLLPGGGTIDGGGGDDHFQVNSGSQTLTGVAAMSLMSSPVAGGFTLYGGDGNDTISTANNATIQQCFFMKFNSLHVSLHVEQKNQTKEVA